MSRLVAFLLCLVLVAPACAQQPDEATIAAVRTTWEGLYEADQAKRRELVALIQEGVPRDDPRFRALATEVHQLDMANQAAFDSLYAAHGWPRFSVYGEQAGSAAFLILQHAALEKQEEFFPLITAMAELGELHKRQYALMLDRILVRRGLPQVYGSQAVPKSTGAYEFAPIENIAELEARRVAVGLPPLQVKADMLGIQTMPEGYVPREK